MLLTKSSGASHAVGTINLRDTYSVCHWAKVFGVSELDLAIAVRRAGPHPRDVAMFLGKSWR